MTVLRIFLFCGLIIHKMIWEIWKRKYPSAVVKKVPASPAKRILKLAKVGFLLFLGIQALFLNIFPIEDVPEFVKYLGISLFIVGSGMSILARVHLGKNWADVEDQQVLPGQALVVSGIYRYLRHPIYIGDVLLVIGFELALQSWLFLIGFVIAMVVYLQAIREEKLLLQAFPDYRDYCARTKRFLPFLF
jgi:protein-S-isoprenylcysteine O-methyltransferase Ste14